MPHRVPLFLHEPHLDIIGPDGGKKRTIDYSILENDQALNVAIQDFKRPDSQIQNVN